MISEPSKENLGPTGASPSNSTSLWSLSKLLRRHPAAALPPGSALSEPPESLNSETAKVALEQVNKRLDAQLTLKGTTESRAITLAGQCTTLLSALTAAVLVGAFDSHAEAFGAQRWPLLAAGIAAAVCLFAAVLFAYSSANPRENGILPGRLPDELWDDLVAPSMDGPEFIGRLMIGLQAGMFQNELNQGSRARALQRAILMVKATVPTAVVVALVLGFTLPLLWSKDRAVPSNQQGQINSAAHSGSAGKP